MERIYIEDMSTIAEIMHGKILDGYEDVDFIGKYEDCSWLIKELLTLFPVSAYQINIMPPEWDGYDREYLVSLDAEMNLWCQKAYQEEHERYVYMPAECTFVADDCNSAVLEKIECDEIYKVGYDLDDEMFETTCNHDCEHCGLASKDDKREEDRHEEITRVATGEDGKIRGFEKSWETHEDGLHYHSTYSFYSSNEKLLKDMMENFKVNY